MYIKGKFLSGMDALEEVWKVREYCGTAQHDSKDATAMHVLAYCVEEESKPVATGRVIYDGEDYWIDAICQTPNESEAYDDFVLKMLIYYAVQHGAEQIKATCDRSQGELYRKNRFVIVDENQKSGIITMLLKNAASHHCCGE